MRVRVGIDTGGTFTDFLVVAGREVAAFKVPSTPDEPSRAFHQGLAIAARMLLARGVEVAATRPWDVAHGFTVATNALLARRGARVVLVTNRHFEDVLAIGRQERPELYALAPRHPAPLVEDGAVVGLAQRTGPHGEAWERLTEAALAAAMRRVRALKPEAVAVGLLHAYADARPERRVRQALARALPAVPVSLSSEVASVHREFERLSTATADAYVSPLVRRYLGRLDAPKLHRLRVMQSNGGAAPAKAIARTPVHTVLSGPAGGVLGAQRLGRAAGLDLLLTLDIGGTSTDVAIVPGRLLATRESVIAGVPLAVPILDVHTVGAGGGSIARVDAGRALAVGPQSAGADPGPACYGHGGPPTVTDAMIVLGRIVPERFLDGGMAIDAGASQAAMAGLARELGTDTVSAAHGVVRVANATIERALRVISVERGHDVRGATLVAFGGGGPLHAAELATLLGAQAVLVPPLAGLLSAWGLLGADELHGAATTLLTTVRRDQPWPVAAVRKALTALARDLARRHGTVRGERREATLALRYEGQSFELPLPAGAPARAARDLRGEFDRAHAQRFGYARPAAAVQIVEVGLEVRRPEPPLPAPPPRARTTRAARLGTARVRVGDVRGAARAVPVWRREELGRDFTAQGPALVIEYGATTYVPPGFRARVDAHGNLRLAPRGASR